MKGSYFILKSLDVSRLAEPGKFSYFTLSLCRRQQRNMNDMNDKRKCKAWKACETLGYWFAH